ncbi:MAG: YfhO family protein [Clostridia bacterium]|nr:YfhO family protein [Clostridia bacterium]
MNKKLNKKFQVIYWILAILLLIVVLFGLKDDHQAVWNLANLTETDDGALHSPYIELKQGTYQLHIQYHANEEAQASAMIGEELLGEVSLLPSETSFDEMIQIPYDTDLFRIIVKSAQVDRITLQGSVLFNYDTIFAALLLLLLELFVYILITGKWWAQQSKEKKITLTVMSLTVIITSLPFMRSQLFGAWDSWAHIARIQGISDALAIGQFPTIIFPQNCNGFGQIGALYPLLFLYPAGMLHRLGISLTACLNFGFIMVNIATAWVMYLSVKSILKSDYAAGFAAVLYCLAPYRILNLYCRHALGELLAMIFIPLIIAGIYHLFAGDAKRYWHYLVIGYTGVIQSHIFTMVLVVWVSLFFGICYLKKLIIEKRLLCLLKTIGITIVFNLWYIVPYFFFYFDGVSNEVLRSDYTSKQTSLKELIAGAHFTGDSGMGMISLIGVACIITCMVGFVINRSKRDEVKNFMLVNFLGACLNIWMVTTLFPWKPFMQNPFIAFLLEMIQFPSRFLSVAVPMLIMSLTFVLTLQSQKNKKRAGIYLVFIVVNLACIMLLFMYAFTDMGGRGSQDGAARADFREYYPKDGGEQCCVNDQYFQYSYDTVITDYSKNTKDLSFTYVSSLKQDELDLPLMYYRGYQAKLLDQTGKKVGMLPVSKGAEARVRVTLTQTQIPMKVVVSYGTPWYFAVTYVISLVAIVIVAAYYYRKRIRT